jgi:hypothetical protein
MNGGALQSFEFGPEDFRELLRQTLARGVPLRFAAAGASMDPFIKDGDVLTVSPLPPRLSPGDIVAAVSPANGLVVVHRAVGLRGGAVLLKGDNLRTPDGLARGDALLGRVTRVERGGRPVTLGIGRWPRAIALLSRINLLRPAARIGAAAKRLVRR